MKVIQYRKAKLEKYAPYLLKDGLVTKLTTYKEPSIVRSLQMFPFSVPTYLVIMLIMNIYINKKIYI